MARVSTRTLVAAGIVVSLLLAGIGSFYASSLPDGLEYVAEKVGFSETATEQAASESPLADYGTRGVDDARLSGGIAGLVGSVMVLGLAGGLFMVLRRRGDSDGDAAGDGRAEADPTAAEPAVQDTQPTPPGRR